MDKTICELFAGVGGFRLGFDRLNSNWETVWFSQWEPGAKTQWAHDCYVKHYGDSPDLKQEYHTGEDISEMVKENIPNHSLLVGGFRPCGAQLLWCTVIDEAIVAQSIEAIVEQDDRTIVNRNADRLEMPTVV